MEDYRQAISYLEQSLVIIREIGDRDAEVITLLDIGGFCYALAEYSQGIDYYQQALTLIRADNGDSLDEARMSEAEVLEYLGVGYGNLAQYSQAINYFEQYLEIVRETGDLVAQGIAWQNLSFVYNSLGDYERFDDCLKESIAIAVEICRDRTVEEMESEEVEYLKKILTICREIEDFATESIVSSIIDRKL
ncbi:hypothetical protein H1P_1380009 [Hyella patelloides LEGE 07179]|uniref:Uncharacterized protein n=1 Tax=Hyella patelloides LEGE 07179 TaxID=945734 RepID=A0A563VL92_9CYAN|nr:hypothetical protein H1P_1380009 [Hyella patelloides LEGE 07179]